MTPGISPGEYFLYEKKSAFASNYLAGDVVIIKTSHSDLWTIKRVIAIESDLVQIINTSILVNSKAVREQEGNSESVNQKIQEWKVGVGELFVLGDNSQLSVDSRIYGPININLIKGRAWLRIWPLGRLSTSF